MGSRTVIIRKPMLAEAEIVFDLINQLKMKPLDYATFRETYEKNLNDPNIYFLIAEADGKRVGFISVHIQQVLHHQLPVAEIMELVIDERSRNQSFGEYLVKHAIDIARSLGCEMIEVASNNTRERAHQFYIRHGFERSHIKLTRPI